MSNPASDATDDKDSAGQGDSLACPVESIFSAIPWLMQDKVMVKFEPESISLYKWQDGELVMVSRKLWQAGYAEVGTLMMAARDLWTKINVEEKQSETRN